MPSRPTTSSSDRHGKPSPTKLPPHRSRVVPSWYRVGVWLLVGVSVVALVASLTLVSVSTNDVWIHITTGQRILESGTIPEHDDYSFVTAGRQYVSHEWLAGVVFALAYRALGVHGLILLKLVVVLATSACLLSICRLHRDRLSAVLIAFGIMGYIAAARFLERPHLFSYLFSAAVLLCLFKYRDGGRRWVWLLPILPIQVLWANLHGGFIQGLAIVGVFALGEAMAFARAQWLGVGNGSWRDLVPLLALPPACVAATAINPYGVRLLEFPFELTGMEVFMANVFEWWPAFHDGFDRTFVFSGYWLWVALLFAGLWLTPGEAALRSRRIAGWRTGAGVALWGSYVLFVYGFGLKQEMLSTAWGIWAAVFLVFCVVHVREVDFAEAGLVALMFVLSMRHNRSIADAVIVTFPIMTRRLTWGLDRLDRIRQRAHSPAERIGGALPATVALVAILILAEAVHVFAWGYRYDTTSVRERGFGIADTMPRCAVDYIVRRGLSGNAYTSYTTAALLLFRRYPAVRVSMDSRNEVYGVELFKEYEGAKHSTEAMAAYLAKYPVDFFVVNHNDLSPAVAKYLLQGGDWVQVFADHKHIVLLRNRPEVADIIQRDAYRAILPSLQGGFRFDRDQAADYLAEADRAAGDCPDSWMPVWYRAQALAALGRTDDAMRAADIVINRNHQAWYAWMLLGNLHAAAGERAKAAEAYGQVLEINPSYQAARDKLRALQLSEGHGG